MIRRQIAIYLLFCTVSAGIFAYAYHTYRESIRAHISADFVALATAEKASFKEVLAAYRALLAAGGATVAQDVLVNNLPNDSRTHMINHETGFFLYEQFGVTGITQCTLSFAGGCFHGFVEAHIAKEGIVGIDTVVQSCRDATITEQEMQCPHGVGHAMLIAAGYPNLPRALDLCLGAFKDDYKSRMHCYDGVFMENGFGPFSVPPADRWYKPDDVMYPCNEPEILAHEGAHAYCWGMQSQATMRADAYPYLGGDVGRIGAYCASLSNKTGDQKLCFEGLSRQLQLRFPEDPGRRAALCAQLPAGEQRPCEWRAFEAAYIYGSREPEVLQMCAHATPEEAPVCHHIFFEGIAISYSQQEARETACATLGEESAACIAWMRSPEAQKF